MLNDNALLRREFALLKHDYKDLDHRLEVEIKKRDDLENHDRKLNFEIS